MSQEQGEFTTNTTMRWLPDPRVAPLAPAIEERANHFASLIRAMNFGEFVDPLMRRMMEDCFRDARAHEGVVWFLDEEKKNLLCAWQTGAHSERLMSFRLPLDSGISGMVLAMQQPFCENNLALNRPAASKLEEKLGVIVCSRVLVPFFIAGRLRGIVAAYQTKTDLDAPEPRGFEPDAVEEISLLARLLTRLFDYKLLCAATGVDED